MENSIEIQQLKVQLTVYNTALQAIYSALSSTQRDIALTIFRTTTKNAQATLQENGTDQEAINFYAELCTWTENTLQGHRSP